MKNICCLEGLNDKTQEISAWGSLFGHQKPLLKDLSSLNSYAWEFRRLE
jgi:hypothetical protein